MLGPILRSRPYISPFLRIRRLWRDTQNTKDRQPCEVRPVHTRECGSPEQVDCMHVQVRCTCMHSEEKERECTP